MSSYWSADDSVRVGEKKVSIPSENGLSYSPGQKVQIFVDPSTKFMDGKETYLECNVKLKLPAGKAPTKLQLDKCTSTLIRNLRIYDGSRGQLLEEITDYASYVSVKYDYDKDRSLENVRALTEGCAVPQPANRGTERTSITPMANTVTNPWFEKTTTDAITVAWADSDFLLAKLTIPLHTGIFADSDTIFPVMLTNGLYIEIDLNEAESIIKQMDSVMRDVRTPLNPFFNNLNGATAAASWAAADGAKDKFYVPRKNNLDGVDRVERFPFVVGETIGFCLATDNASTVTFNNVITITEINMSQAADGAAGLIEVKHSGATVTAGAVTNAHVMFSTSVSSETSYDATYEVSNVNLVVSQVMLDPAYESGMIQKVREGKAIEFDIKSVTNYKHSILASDRQTTFQIFARNSRARSLMIVPQDSTVYTSAQLISATGTYSIKGSDSTNACATTKDTQDTSLAATRSAYTGIIDQLSSVQYQVNGKRVPSREISTRKIATRNSIDAFHLYELEKTLDNAGISPKSFSSFLDNFVIGRGFSAGGQFGVMDLRDKDLAVTLRYQTTTAPTVGKLFNSYVFHIRRLVIRDGAQVDLVM